MPPDRRPRHLYRLTPVPAARWRGGLAAEPPARRSIRAVGGFGRRLRLQGHMNRSRRIGRVGGLVACAVAATPFAFLWVQMLRTSDEPVTAQVRLDLAIWMTVFATPAMVAAWLVWRAAWGQAGARLAALDGPGWLLAAAEGLAVGGGGGGGGRGGAARPGGCSPWSLSGCWAGWPSWPWPARVETGARVGRGW